MVLYSKGSPDDQFTREDLRVALFETLKKLGEKHRVLAIPPDFTRFHSQAGLLTELVWECYKERLADVLPSIGTHYPMTEHEIEVMFGKVPKSLFRVHDWRRGLVTLGEVPAHYVKDASEGRVNYGVPIQVDKLLVEGKYDLILSIGQVVPHEVIGMANYNKNVFVGTGGAEGINKTHFLGAAYGMERIMGRADTPVRRVLNYGSDNFARHLPIVYILTVVAKDSHGNLVVRGLYIGDDADCFHQASELSLRVNFELLDEPLKKVVVYLDPSEFKSTWLGNKSIYRTRMAIADGGELIVLAPGLAQFGEDVAIDKLIRKYGYVGTPRVLELVETHQDLKDSLGAAAHLIHGSSEGRFSITYCPGRMTQQEIEGVGFRYADLGEMIKRYNPKRLTDGPNVLPNGESVFFISNPALGLWAYKERFDY
jgi:nickel-dependent lactate racemase